MFLFSQSCSNVKKQNILSSHHAITPSKIKKNWPKNKKAHNLTHRSYDVYKVQLRATASPKKMKGQKISLKQMKQKHVDLKHHQNKTAYNNYQLQQTNYSQFYSKSKKVPQYETKTKNIISCEAATQNMESNQLYNHYIQKNNMIQSDPLYYTSSMHPEEELRVNLQQKQSKKFKQLISYQFKQFFQNNKKIKDNQEQPINKYKSPQNQQNNRQILRKKISSSPQKSQNLRIFFNGNSYLSRLKANNITQVTPSSLSPDHHDSANFYPISNSSLKPQKNNQVFQENLNPQAKPNIDLYSSLSIDKKIKTQPKYPDFMFQSSLVNKKSQQSPKIDTPTKNKNKVIKKDSFRKPFPDLSQATPVQKKQTNNNQVFRPFAINRQNQKIKQKVAEKKPQSTNIKGPQIIVSNCELGIPQMNAAILQPKLALSEFDPNEDNRSDNSSIVLYQMTKDNKFSLKLQKRIDQIPQNDNLLHKNYKRKGDPTFLTSLCGNNTDRSQRDQKITFGKGITLSQRSQQSDIEPIQCLISNRMPYNSMDLQQNIIIKEFQYESQHDQQVENKMDYSFTLHQ